MSLETIYREYLGNAIECKHYIPNENPWVSLDIHYNINKNIENNSSKFADKECLKQLSLMLDELDDTVKELTDRKKLKSIIAYYYTR